MINYGTVAHRMCSEANGHQCQKPSGRTCVERGCAEPAGTLWGPLWCPDHDAERLDRVGAELRRAAGMEESP